MKFKIPHKLIIYIEPIGAAIIGLIFFVSLERKDLAEITWILGAIIALNSVTVVSSIKNDLNEKMTKLSNINEIFDLYMKIDDDDFIKLKENTMNSAYNTLYDLKEGKYEVKEENTYYIWLINQMKKMKKGGKVKAVTVMDECLWLDIPQERLFYEENKKAIENKVEIERVFITNEIKLQNQRNRKAILNSIFDGIKTYIIFENNLSSGLKEIIGNVGFIIFDERVLLIDTGIKPATGKVSKKNYEINQYTDVFEQLKIQTEDASCVIIEIIQKQIEIFTKKYGDIENLEKDETQDGKNNCNIWKEMNIDLNKLI